LGTFEGGNFTFGTQFGDWGANEKCKIRAKRVMMPSRDLLLEFWYRLHISETVEARNFKFGRQFGHEG